MAAQGSDATGRCAYCSDALPPYERYFCTACCPSGPGAPWHACRPCVNQREAAVSGGALKRQCLDGDSSEPCFEAGHAFAPVVGSHQGGWVILEPGGEAGKLRRVRRFVRQYRLPEAPPSLAWIAVRGSGAREGPPADGRPQQVRVAAAMADWAAEQQRGKPTQEAALEIGRRHHILDGKWMLLGLTDRSSEAIWAAVARAVYAAGLATLAKVTAGPLHPGQSRCICIYTGDFNDSEEAMRVHAGLSAALRAALPQRDWSKRWTIYYKPDIFTYLGLYANRETNPHRLRSTIYSAAL
ncbi:hypothetical protein ABPG75_004434 [Micractinium tetrahymenae]